MSIKRVNLNRCQAAARFLATILSTYNEGSAADRDLLEKGHFPLQALDHYAEWPATLDREPAEKRRLRRLAYEAAWSCGMVQILAPVMEERLYESLGRQYGNYFVPSPAKVPEKWTQGIINLLTGDDAPDAKDLEEFDVDPGLILPPLLATWEHSRSDCMGNKSLEHVMKAAPYIAVCLYHRAQAPGIAKDRAGDVQFAVAAAVGIAPSPLEIADQMEAEILAVANGGKVAKMKLEPLARGYETIRKLVARIEELELKLGDLESKADEYVPSADLDQLQASHKALVKELGQWARENLTAYLDDNDETSWSDFEPTKEALAGMPHGFDADRYIEDLVDNIEGTKGRKKDVKQVVRDFKERLRAEL